MKTRILMLLLLAAGGTAAQTTLQVVTKTVQKTVSWKPGYSVEINCEKAEIDVETAPAGQNAVSVKAELSARHPKLDSARHDLDAWKFVTSTIGKKIYIRAYIGLPSGTALPASNLKAKLKVIVPADCPTTLSNKFGSARLEKIAAPVSLSGDFCAFTLLQLGGKVQVDSRYGNVDGKQLSGPVEVQTKRADVSLAGLGSDCTVRSEYGSVQVEAAAQTGNVTVQSSKGDVTVAMPQPYRHNLDLKADHGEVTMPLSLRLGSGTSGDQHHASLHQGDNLPRILVETTLGNIIVK
ncbi:MAG: hypothetical protein DYG98_07855 [Haliscomenobacteraceae bacterium CHB4]|nr:hypothetical protein [Saprospiraceae bacterium]MCE7922957.1 hypothetical protein [Haliscomenobacteraceae bacterium CHB4]